MKKYLVQLIGVVLIIAVSSCGKSDNFNSPTEETPDLPTLTTSSVDSISYSSAVCGGNITSNGGSDIIARGICWNTEPYPTIANNHTTDGKGKGSFSSSIKGLAQVTKYYIRAYATNNTGTRYGNEQSFTTLEDTRIVTDIDGNTYKTVKIGEQIWMAENLKVTTLNDGTVMTSVSDATQWWQQSVSTTLCAYCSYSNSDNNAQTYGRLYNWNAVYSGKICPKGWHIPTNSDWGKLRSYLIQNGYNYDKSTTGNLVGKSLASTTIWTYSDKAGTVGNDRAGNNKSGFNALPGGFRDDNGIFDGLGNTAIFWCMPSESYAKSKFADYYLLSYKNNSLVTNAAPSGYSGHSVRCIKD